MSAPDSPPRPPRSAEEITRELRTLTERRASHRLALYRAQIEVERCQAAVRADGQRINALLDELRR